MYWVAEQILSIAASALGFAAVRWTNQNVWWALVWQIFTIYVPMGAYYLATHNYLGFIWNIIVAAIWTLVGPTLLRTASWWQYGIMAAIFGSGSWAWFVVSQTLQLIISFLWEFYYGSPPGFCWW